MEYLVSIVSATDFLHLGLRLLFLSLREAQTHIVHFTFGNIF